MDVDITPGSSDQVRLKVLLADSLLSSWLYLASTGEVKLERDCNVAVVPILSFHLSV